MPDFRILLENNDFLMTEDDNNLRTEQGEDVVTGTRRTRRYAHIKQSGMKHIKHGHRFHSILLFITGLINGN